MDQGEFKIEMRPIGFVSRTSSDEDSLDRSLVSRIVLDQGLAPALDGIQDYSHVFVIYWLDKITEADRLILHFPGDPVGILATRVPKRPNPIGLSLVELVRHEGNILWVKSLDAFDGTPILDIKPYPEWVHGQPIVVTDFRVPAWLSGPRVIERVDAAG